MRENMEYSGIHTVPITKRNPGLPLCSEIFACSPEVNGGLQGIANILMENLLQGSGERVGIIFTLYTFTLRQVKAQFSVCV